MAAIVGTFQVSHVGRDAQLTEGGFGVCVGTVMGEMGWGCLARRYWGVGEDDGADGGVFVEGVAGIGKLLGGVGFEVIRFQIDRGE